MRSGENTATNLLESQIGTIVLAGGVLVDVVDVGKESTDRMDTIRSRNACSSCPMINPSPERKASIEVVDGGSTPRNAPVTDLSGREASAESLTPRRSNLAVEDTVDFQFGFFSSAAALGSTLSLGRTLRMSPEG
jgi:hypothetical protein